MNTLQIAEKVAYDGYMNYHRARMQLDQGLQMVDQIRKYEVIEREEQYIVTYRNGFDAGKPTLYAMVNKETGSVEYV